MNLLLPDKVLRFELPCATFHGIGKHRCVGTAPPIARRADERLVRLRVIHMDHQRRWARAAADCGPSNRAQD